jgi:hypothetical protein
MPQAPIISDILTGFTNLGFVIFRRQGVPWNIVGRNIIVGG